MDSNRVRLAVIRETSLGVPPGTLRLRTARITAESLNYTPQLFVPAELRADRMSADPTKINETNAGGIAFEFSYPVDGTFLSEVYQSGFFGSWKNSPQRDNDGVAASVITAITVTTNVVTVTTGAAYVVGHVVRQTGFGIAGNNGTFVVTTGGATSYTCTAGAFATEASPPAAARSKVVGFQAATAADVQATATGLSSTTLNFTTLGLVVGQWIKIGGTATATKFATAANNDWARITAITATALTLDNLPTGWAIDTAATKTIRCYFGDYLRNGVNVDRVSLAIERAYLDQATPTYIWQKGMVVNALNLTLTDGQAITGSAEFMGISGGQGIVANGSSYDAATRSDLYPVMTANVSVGRIAEAGTTMVSPNWARSLSIQLTNNLRMITAVGTVGAVEIGLGEIGVSGTLETYFGSNALLTKLMAGTPSSISARTAANNQAVIWTLPRVTFTGGSANAGGKNQNVMLPLQYQTSIDPVTACEIDCQRFEYWDA